MTDSRDWFRIGETWRRVSDERDGLGLGHKLAWIWRNSPFCTWPQFIGTATATLTAGPAAGIATHYAWKTIEQGLEFNIGGALSSTAIGIAALSGLNLLNDFSLDKGFGFLDPRDPISRQVAKAELRRLNFGSTEKNPVISISAEQYKEFKKEPLDGIEIPASQLGVGDGAKVQIRQGFQLINFLGNPEDKIAQALSAELNRLKPEYKGNIVVTRKGSEKSGYTFVAEVLKVKPGCALFKLPLGNLGSPNSLQYPVFRYNPDSKSSLPNELNNEKGFESLVGNLMKELPPADKLLALAPHATLPKTDIENPFKPKYSQIIASRNNSKRIRI